MSYNSTRLGIVTGEEAPELTEDGQALTAALDERDINAESVQWRASHDWTAFDALVIRSCWEYYRDPTMFEAWLETVASAPPVVYNPVDVVRWNAHKFYLRDLRSEGVQTLETAFVEQSSDRDLGAILDERGWDEAVVKPAVGTSSEGVFRVSSTTADEHRGDYDDLRADGDVLVQRFAPEVTDGERSFVFFRGDYSHANRSIPAEGDYRAHPDFGGRTEPYEPPARTIDDAAGVLQAAADCLGIDVGDLLYARVDGVERGGEFLLMELELIEPYLGLREGGAVEQFADAIHAVLAEA